jgi:hypothetical protein
MEEVPRLAVVGAIYKFIIHLAELNTGKFGGTFVSDF